MLRLALLTLLGSVALSSGLAAIGWRDSVWLGFVVGTIWALISLGIARRRGWL